MNDNRETVLRIAVIEIMFGWFLIGIALFLHLTNKLEFNETTAILIPAVLAVALFKLLFDSVSSKLIVSDNLLTKNIFSTLFATAVVAGLIFVYLSKIIQLPDFVSARFTMICSVIYTCFIYYRGKKNNIPRQRFYAYLTLILLIILNFRGQDPLNRAIVLLITIGFAHLILPILSIFKSIRKGKS